MPDCKHTDYTVLTFVMQDSHTIVVTLECGDCASTTQDTIDLNDLMEEANYEPRGLVWDKP